MYINSPGGSVTAGLAIYDTMQLVEPDISTYCLGQAASMGAVLLAGGTKGKRFALPNSRVMIHQPWGGVRRHGQGHGDPGARDPEDEEEPREPSSANTAARPRKRSPKPRTGTTSCLPRRPRTSG